VIISKTADPKGSRKLSLRIELETSGEKERKSKVSRKDSHNEQRKVARRQKGVQSPGGGKALLFNYKTLKTI